MRSLPAPLRDFVTGLGIVGLVILVLRVVDPRGVGPETWVLLPIGAALFTMRQGVRRVVLRRVEGDPPDDDTPAAAAPRSWQEDPVRVLGLGVLVAVALAALAFL